MQPASSIRYSFLRGLKLSSRSAPFASETRAAEGVREGSESRDVVQSKAPVPPSFFSFVLFCTSFPFPRMALRSMLCVQCAFDGQSAGRGKTWFLALCRWLARSSSKVKRGYLNALVVCLSVYAYSLCVWICFGLIKSRCMCVYFPKCQGVDLYSRCIYIYTVHGL